MKISIILADDHELLRKSVASLLRCEFDFDVVGECANGREALSLAIQLTPAVVILDVAMPELNGLETARLLKEAVPASRVIMLSNYIDKPYVRAALTAGAVGYIVKSGAARDLVEAVRTASRGKPYLSNEVSTVIGMERVQIRNSEEQAGNVGASIYSGIERRQHTDGTVHCPLSPREREVLQLIAEGHAAKQIAASLGITEQTAKSHRKNIVTKLGIHETAGLTRYAIRVGITRV